MLHIFLAPGIIDSATVLMQLIFTGEMLPDVCPGAAAERRRHQDLAEII